MRLRTSIVVLCTLLAAAGCSASEEPTSDSPAAPPGIDREGAETRPGETATGRDSVSTFALDVDTASYTYAARQLRDGNRPSAGSIRPEEFVNYFDQHYPQPRGDGFAVHVDGARLPAGHEGGSDLRLLRIGLQTRAEDTVERKDAALTFVVDVSGSMDSDDRLGLVKDALHTLVDQLRATDSVAIVAFDDQATVLRQMTRVAEKSRLHDAVDQLRPGGSTNLDAGLVAGYRTARDGFRPGLTNRVILLSDGLANTGNTDADRMLSKIREEADKEIALLGVGVGSEYGDKLMERLADRGDGFVVYVSQRQQAREVFVKRLPATLSVRALDAKAQVVFDPAAVQSYQLLGYDNRQLADEDFRDDRVDGGEVGPGHSVTALYLVRLRPQAASGRVAEVKVRWLDPKSRTAAEGYESVAVSDLGGGFDASDARLRVCYAASYFGVILQRRGDSGVRLSDLASIARQANGLLEDRKVDELITLIDMASRLD